MREVVYDLLCVNNRKMITSIYPERKQGECFSCFQFIPLLSSCLKPRFQLVFRFCFHILMSQRDESRLNEHDGTQLRKYCKYLYFTITMLPNSGMNIGLNAFLAIANHLEKKEGNPPMPGSNFSYPSG